MLKRIPTNRPFLSSLVPVLIMGVIFGGSMLFGREYIGTILFTSPIIVGLFSVYLYGFADGQKLSEIVAVSICSYLSLCLFNVSIVCAIKIGFGEAPWSGHVNLFLYFFLLYGLILFFLGLTLSLFGAFMGLIFTVGLRR